MQLKVRDDKDIYTEMSTISQRLWSLSSAHMQGLCEGSSEIILPQTIVY